MSMNFNRALWASKAVAAFQLATNCDDDEQLPDLLCNLMHWADNVAYADFEKALARARANYEVEKEEDA